LPEPEFIQDEDFRIIIHRKNVTPNIFDNQSINKNVTPNVTPKIEKNLKRVKDELEMIMGNKHISAEELATCFGVTIRTIRRDLNRLRSSFKIEWIPTSPSPGYWEVSTEDVQTEIMDDADLSNVRSELIEKQELIDMSVKNDANDDVSSDVSSLSVVQLSERQKKICELIRENPFISGEQMSVVLSVVPRTVWRDLAVLQKKGILLREEIQALVVG